MIIPTKNAFQRYRARVVRQAAKLRHPRWLKYDWWIVTEDNPLTGRADPRFRGQGYKLTTFDAMQLAMLLDQAGVRYFIYNWTIKRDDPSAPWDIPRLRREGRRVAPAYDDDCDPPWQEHK